MQTTATSYQQNQAALCRPASNNMASFVARLMSLSAHELQCLHADSELMRHLSQTQLLMESRLQNMSLESKLLHQLQQQQQQHQQQHFHQQQHHQQHQLSSPTTAGYYYAPAANQQQEHQHRQLLLAAPTTQHHAPGGQLALDLRTTPTDHLSQQLRADPSSHFALVGSYATTSPAAYHNQQQHHHLYPQQMQLQMQLQRHHGDGASPACSSPADLQQPPQQHQHMSLARSSSASSGDGSASGRSSSSGGGGAGNSCNGRTSAKTSAPSARSFNPKKVKLGEYHNQQQQLLHLDEISANQPGETQLLQQQQQATNQQAAAGKTKKAPAVKKYKGEFDEPSPADVEQRQRMLASADNYHWHLAPELRHLGECACVLGTQFRDKSVRSVLEMIDQWRQLATEERIRAKWDVGDLPMDIPLSDIKKYEDLRREASKGRADFGGASKRKPLGIRGTRQFLLVLYCLWGHPGRDDVMQKEGYCPHCFAKIKKANEQSTLVRVVNHFNMKHRRGANPRLSPHRDISPPALPALDTRSPQQQQSHQVKTKSNEERKEQLFADLLLLASSSTEVAAAAESSPAAAPAASACPTKSKSPGAKQQQSGANTTTTNRTSTKSPSNTLPKLEAEHSTATTGDFQKKMAPGSNAKLEVTNT